MTQEMVETADLFADIFPVESFGTPRSEQVIHAPSIHPDCWGTADAIAYFENYLKFEKSAQAADMIAEVKAVIEGLKEELKG